MKIEILGCSGGMGGGEFTTSIRIDEHVLIDAGSGLGRMSQNEMLNIRQIFLTHAHMDHICFLPLLLDNLFEQLESSVEVLALPDTLDVLRKHIFNWQIWPDFSCLPSAENPVLRFTPLALEHPVFSEAGFSITPICAQHVVPACGYRIEGVDGKVFCFSGDTLFNSEVVEAYNRLGSIEYLMVECAFPNRLQSVADQSQHLTPNSLADFISSLKMPPKKLLITHLKPTLRKEIAEQLRQLNLPVELTLLQSGDTFLL